MEDEEDLAPLNEECCIFDTSNGNIRVIEAQMEREMDEIYSTHLRIRLDKHFGGEHSQNDSMFSEASYIYSSPAPLSIPRSSRVRSNALGRVKLRSYVSKRRLKKTTTTIYNRKFIKNMGSCDDGSSVKKSSSSGRYGMSRRLGGRHALRNLQHRYSQALCCVYEDLIETLNGNVFIFVLIITLKSL